MIIGNAIFAYDRQKLFIKTLAIGVVTNVALDLILIPLWGGPGSAIATLIVQLCINLFLWINLQKINPLIKFPNLIKTFGAAFCLATALLIFKYFEINFIASGILASLIYLTILFLLKEPVLNLFKK
jgi:Na+-driven multidrug efflux pump